MAVDRGSAGVSTTLVVSLDEAVSPAQANLVESEALNFLSFSAVVDPVMHLCRLTSRTTTYLLSPSPANEFRPGSILLCPHEEGT